MKGGSHNFMFWLEIKLEVTSAGPEKLNLSAGHTDIAFPSIEAPSIVKSFVSNLADPMSDNYLGALNDLHT